MNEKIFGSVASVGALAVLAVGAFRSVGGSLSGAAWIGAGIVTVAAVVSVLRPRASRQCAPRRLER